LYNRSFLPVTVSLLIPGTIPFKKKVEPSMVVHYCDPSVQEAKAEVLRV
jgi:hypothetical protein